MKHLFSLLLCCLLLCSCAAEANQEDPSAESPSTPQTTAVTEQTLYISASDLEISTKGALRPFRLPVAHATGMLAWEDGLLVFSGEEHTVLTLLAGEDLQVSATAALDFPLSAQDPSVQIHETGLSFFDPGKQETVVLDNSLKTVSRIAAPEDLVGSPILSEDRNSVYYCTANAVLAWNLETDIRRTLKEMAYTEQTLLGLHMEESVLQCRILDGTVERILFLRSENGQHIHTHNGDITLTDSGRTYFSQFAAGSSQVFLFGTGEEPPMSLIPRDTDARCHYLPENHAALTVSAPNDSSICLAYYDLNNGCRKASVTYPSQNVPADLAAVGKQIYMLSSDPDSGCDVLIRWDPEKSAVSDAKAYTSPYYTAEDPDLDGIAQCRLYAREIADRHGIEILIWKDAAAVQPWDYDFQSEHLVPVIRAQLEQLELGLSHYPEGMLAQTASHFSSLKICLVRQITGSAESGSLAQANGLQFFDGTDAYVVIAAGPYADHALYHELFHAMETHLLTNTTAFDRWDELNPTGFSYDYDYEANAKRDSGIYLQKETRSFIDTYSMSFPKEDKARVMEYAMLPGNESLFHSQAMQRKLKALSQGLREAYGLEKAETVFRWEQYLE